MIFICNTECFWRSKLFKPGDTYVAGPDERLQKDDKILEPNEVPRHFTAVDSGTENNGSADKPKIPKKHKHPEDQD